METDIAWAAGILEGEGSFLTQTSGFSCKVSCQMTDLDVLEELAGLFGGKVYTITKRKKHWKDSWVWCISGDVAKECMEKIYPYMKSRRKKKIDEVILTWITYGKPYVHPEGQNILAAQAYIAGEGSYRQLQSKYGVGFETIRQTVNKIKNGLEV